MSISLIVAYSEPTRVIGADNKIPWHIPEDLKFFKDMTVGKIVVMGRRTYESLPNASRPLPCRTTYVLTRDTNYTIEHPDVKVFNDIGKCLMMAKLSTDEVMVAGGSEIYKASLPYADKIYTTVIAERFEGDIKFPILSEKEWTVIEEGVYVSEQLELFYTRQVYKKCKK